jgi:predicted metalloendopeptidase
VNSEEKINSEIEKEEIIQDTIIDGGLPTAEIPKEEISQVFLTLDENTNNDEDLKQLDDEMKEIGKVKTVEITNANYNRPKKIGHPSPQIDPTLL